MSKIIFSSEPNKVYECNFKQINQNIIRLSFESSAPDIGIIASGFDIVNEHNNRVMTTRNGYQTVYRTYKEDNVSVVEMSNNGSVFIPVSPIEPTIPTPEEIELIFEESKQQKILESKYLLSIYLEENPLESSCHGGRLSYYNVTPEKQALMTSNYLTYTIEKTSGIGTPVLTWNATGEECEEWTEDEFVQLILETSNYVKPLVTKQQKYEVSINNCESQEELNNIIIDYSFVQNEEVKS